MEGGQESEEGNSGNQVSVTEGEDNVAAAFGTYGGCREFCS